MKTKISLLLLCMCASLGAVAQSAGQAGQKNGQNEMKGPPPEAFTACKGKKAKDSCSVSTPRGTMTGSCEMPRGTELVCAPAGGPGSAK